MARQAQAEREKQARVILGSAEAAIASSFVAAADLRWQEARPPSQTEDWSGRSRPTLRWSRGPQHDCLRPFALGRGPRHGRSDLRRRDAGGTRALEIRSARGDGAERRARSLRAGPGAPEEGHTPISA
ncbi:MAG TPA: hypothetical protein VIC29_07470 [Steroidobacteraceae bacterium]